MVLRPCGGDWDLYIGFGWTGLKKIGVKISEVLKLYTQIIKGFPMNIDLTYWYLFPVGLVIATLAMSAGISGANFWIPVYLICVKLDPLVTFWLALITMIFGFGSGVVRNIHQGTVNWYLVRQYLIPTIPGAVIGALLTSYVNGEVLVFIFGSFIFIYGSFLLKSSISSRKAQVRHNRIFWGVGFLAGFLKGFIATGLGKLIVPGMWNHEKVSHCHHFYYKYCGCPDQDEP